MFMYNSLSTIYNLLYNVNALFIVIIINVVIESWSCDTMGEPIWGQPSQWKYKVVLANWYSGVFISCVHPLLIYLFIFTYIAIKKIHLLINSWLYLVIHMYFLFIYVLKIQYGTTISTLTSFAFKFIFNQHSRI